MTAKTPGGRIAIRLHQGSFPMYKSFMFDDCVVTGIAHEAREIHQWQSHLPEDTRSRILAIVESPSWDELPYGTTTKYPSVSTSEEILTVPSLFLGILTVVAILSSIFFGFIFQSAVTVYLCLTVAALSLTSTILMQSRRKGIAAAFGIDPSIYGTSTRAGFVKIQMSIAETLRISGVVISLLFLIQFLWVVFAIDRRYFGEEDSILVASIRSGILLLIPILIWIGWYSYSRKRGALYYVARCMRGFLARNLSPLWVSWLYEAKRKPTKVDIAEPRDRTMKQVAAEYWLLLALFLVCFVFLANTQWLEGRFSVEAIPSYRRGKWHWVNGVVQWLFQHPTSTLFIAAPVGSFAISSFAFPFLKLAIPKFAQGFSIVLFFASILLFAMRGGA